MALYKPKTDRKETSPTKRSDVYGRWKAGYSIQQIVELENLPPQYDSLYYQESRGEWTQNLL